MPPGAYDNWISPCYLPAQFPHLIATVLMPTQSTSQAAVSRGPSPNRGASVPDVECLKGDSESKRAWQRKRGIDLSKQVRLVKLSHMRYQHPDLNRITTFLRGEFVALLASLDAGNPGAC